jgi:site-specific DNA recombinase
LELGFNSLDAQGETCEADIKSQAHEGWQILGDHYMMLPIPAGRWNALP